MENVWSYISREVYANRKQYRTVNELKRAIIAACKTVDIPYLTSLYDIIPKCITQKSEMTSLISTSKGGKVSDENENLREFDEECERIQVHNVPKLENDDNKDDWITIETDFTMVYAVTRSHISGTGPFATKCNLDEDCIYMTIIEAKDVPSRMAIVRFLLAIEHDKHNDFEFCKAYILWKLIFSKLLH
ncbi:hypothetical protein WR25_20445 [Diploscapter pachys]|uniref:Uncharacterized protein n=1 Tax=Diploscapter pachys TaxID=2018661 RepID=A0A2A2LJC8_9BILA|nr:hypothetical protein WR25_20445 [Diploscapter pachys]